MCCCGDPLVTHNAQFLCGAAQRGKEKATRLRGALSKLAWGIRTLPRFRRGKLPSSMFVL